MATDASVAKQVSMSSGGWAIGGTAAMTALAHYPDPFSDAAAELTCTPTCEMILGPCHDANPPEREDISEGQQGLPMRLGLRFLDEHCRPVTDADVDIWHCDALGVYSSETNDTPSFCTGDDAKALKARYFRGHRKTDAQGVAWFNTCFPGWYHGRTVHVHYRVLRPSVSGQEYLVSQLEFPAALVTELFAGHPDYMSHGQPDTTNSRDGIIPDEARYTFQTQRMSDGALLAHKTVTLRSALSAPLCSVGTFPGPRGPGPWLWGLFTLGAGAAVRALWLRRRALTTAAVHSLRAEVQPSQSTD